jgi:hypothetical protein
MVTTDLIINILNSFDARTPIQAPELLPPPEQETIEQSQGVQDQHVVEEHEEQQEPNQKIELPDLIEAPEYESEDEDNNSGQVQDIGIASRTRRQTGTQVRRPDRYTMASVKISKAKEKDFTRKQGIENSEKDEINLLFEDLQGLKPVHKQDVRGKAYSCHMFTVEKFLANGDHHKYKSRLVMNGNEQDPEVFPDRCSPTAAIHFLITCLTVGVNNGIKEL